jgi:hypothetical protein
MMLKTISVWTLMGLLTLGPVALGAQVTPPPGGQRQRLELERRLQLGFQRQIQSQLGLDESSMTRVRAVMQSFQQDRRALNQDQAALRYKLRNPALAELEEGEARAILQEMVDLQQRELDLYKQEQAELLEVLSPVAVLRFYKAREDLGLRVQQLRQGRGQGGGRGAIGGGDSPPAGRGGGGRIFR